jgi:membrane fusion protein (multidrug efflux system)
MSETLETKQPRATPEAPANGQPAPPTPAETVKDRRPLLQKPAFRIFITILVVLAIGGTVYYLYSRQFEETDDAFVDGHVVPITPQISALVAKVNINDNTLVHAGDVMVELDPTDYKVAVEQAKGAEAAAAGKLEQAQSSVPAANSAVDEAKAELASANVTFGNADRDYQRYLHLDEGARSPQQIDNAKATMEQAKASVDQATAKLESARSQVKTAEANVVAAKGDLQKAQADTLRAMTNLGYCQIKAPCDGRITNKNVDPGMYVTSSTQLFQLVPLEVYVTANFKETQLDHMQPGQSCSIHVDAYPDREFTGKVQSIQSGTGSRFSVIPAENATGNFVKVVQRVPVKITFDGEVNKDLNRLLSPGMSVEPKVRIRE